MFDLCPKCDDLRGYMLHPPSEELNRMFSMEEAIFKTQPHRKSREWAVWRGNWQNSLSWDGSIDSC